MHMLPGSQLLCMATDRRLRCRCRAAAVIAGDAITHLHGRTLRLLLIMQHWGKPRAGKQASQLTPGRFRCRPLHRRRRRRPGAQDRPRCPWTAPTAGCPPPAALKPG